MFNGIAMIINMKHDIMKKLCGRKTHNILSILKKIEAKNERLHFLRWLEFHNDILESYPSCARGLDK
jgi:hypothetical protein